jgi:hypothetical protein
VPATEPGDGRTATTLRLEPETLEALKIVAAIRSAGATTRIATMAAAVAEGADRTRRQARRACWRTREHGAPKMRTSIRIAETYHEAVAPSGKTRPMSHAVPTGPTRGDFRRV